MMSLRCLHKIVLCLALSACSSVGGGSGSSGPGGLVALGEGGVGAVSNSPIVSGATGDSGDETGGDTGTGAVGGDNSGGQPSQGTIPAPKRWFIAVQVEYPRTSKADLAGILTTSENENQKKFRRDMAEGILSGELSTDFAVGPFEYVQPIVTLWRQGMTEPEYSKPTDAWGWARLKYTIISSRNQPCIDNFYLQACHIEGTKNYQSDMVLVECPQQNNRDVTVKLPLRELPTGISCPPENSIMVDPSSLFFAE